MAIGPTGEFPLGTPLRNEDRGGVYAGLAPVPGMRALKLDFGTDVSWVALPPQQAVTVAHAYRRIVHRYFGKLDYDASTLPFKITANQAKRVIECDFKTTVGIMVANPELYLGWADHLEKAASELGTAQ